MDSITIPVNDHDTRQNTDAAFGGGSEMIWIFVRSHSCPFLLPNNFCNDRARSTLSVLFVSRPGLARNDGRGSSVVVVVVVRGGRLRGTHYTMLVATYPFFSKAETKGKYPCEESDEKKDKKKQRTAQCAQKSQK